MIANLYVVFLGLLTLLSLRTLAVLGGAAPWTSLGWLATIGYDTAATYELLAHVHLPAHLPYLLLGALLAAFVVAGVRDEPQGEPWWWPRVRGGTRAERRVLQERRGSP
jgi:hypothetical protein